jgi:phage terminase large subunit-like protein
LEPFTRFCGELLTTDTGRPLVLEGFQKEILGGYFAGVRETLCLLSKKNGKTSLLAALGLYELCSIPNAEVAIVAASRDQAQLILRQARGYIRRSERLRERLRVVQREIRHTRLGGEMRVLAADSDTLDGWIGDRAFLDELGRWDSFENYLLLRDGVVPRDGRLVAISTAGDHHDSPLGRLRRRAHEPVERDPESRAHRIAQTPDFVMHEWALDESEDVTDMEVVKLANPASWMTVPELRRRYDSPATQEWMWRRFACGQWELGEDAAIDQREWAACAGKTGIPKGAQGIVVGCDFGWKWDCTAIVPTWLKDGIAIIEPPAVIEPPRDGTSLPVERVFEVFKWIAERWPNATIVGDPEAGGELVLQRVDNELGLRVATYSQRNPMMCAAAQKLAETVAEGKLRHPDDPQLNRHILAASPKFVGESWKLVKGKSGHPIDGAIALAMALVMLTAEKPASTVYFS